MPRMTTVNIQGKRKYLLIKEPTVIATRHVIAARRIFPWIFLTSNYQSKSKIIFVAISHNRMPMMRFN
jgi:hypothetical protein